MADQTREEVLRHGMNYCNDAQYRYKKEDFDAAANLIEDKMNTIIVHDPGAIPFYEGGAKRVPIKKTQSKTTRQRSQSKKKNSSKTKNNHEPKDLFDSLMRDDGPVHEGSMYRMSEVGSKNSRRLSSKKQKGDGVLLRVNPFKKEDESREDVAVAPRNNDQGARGENVRNDNSRNDNSRNDVQASQAPKIKELGLVSQSYFDQQLTDFFDVVKRQRVRQQLQSILLTNRIDMLKNKSKILDYHLMPYNIAQQKAAASAQAFEKTNMGGIPIDTKTVVIKQPKDAEYIVRKEINHYLFPVIKQGDKYKSINDNQQMVLYRYYCVDPVSLEHLHQMKSRLVNKRPLPSCTWPISVSDVFSCEIEFQNIILASAKHFADINLTVNKLKKDQKGNDAYMDPDNYKALRARGNERDAAKEKDQEDGKKMRRMVGGAQEEYQYDDASQNGARDPAEVLQKLDQTKAPTEEDDLDNRIETEKQRLRGKREQLSKLMRLVENDNAEMILQQIVLNRNLSQCCDKLTELLMNKNQHEEAVTKHKKFYYFDVLEEYFAYSAAHLISTTSIQRGDDQGPFSVRGGAYDDANKKQFSRDTPQSFQQRDERITNQDVIQVATDVVSEFKKDFLCMNTIQQEDPYYDQFINLMENKRNQKLIVSSRFKFKIIDCDLFYPIVQNDYFLCDESKVVQLLETDSMRTTVISRLLQKNLVGPSRMILSKAAMDKPDQSLSPEETLPRKVVYHQVTQQFLYVSMVKRYDPQEQNKDKDKDKVDVVDVDDVLFNKRQSQTYRIEVIGMQGNTAVLYLSLAQIYGDIRLLNFAEALGIQAQRVDLDMMQNTLNTIFI